MENNNKGMSKTRKIYFLRLIGRIIVFIITILVYIFDASVYAVADG